MLVADLQASAANTTPRTVTLRGCKVPEFDAVRHVLNAAAQEVQESAGWAHLRQPPLSEHELAQELVFGVAFWGAEVDGTLVAVIGVQSAEGCDLIKHAYVDPAHQRRGMGSALLGYIAGVSRRTLIAGVRFEDLGAVRFYLRLGFRPLSNSEVVRELIARYWTAADGRPKATMILTLASAYGLDRIALAAQCPPVSVPGASVSQVEGNGLES